MVRTKKRSHGSPPQYRSDTAPLFDRKTFLATIAIAIAVIASYWPSIHGGFQWDDDEIVVENPLVRAPDGLSRMWFTTEAIDYWPVTNTSFWIEWRLFGNDPTGYHVVSLIMHIANTWLIWIVLRRLSMPGAFLAALMWAAHPVNVESVAWLVQRKNTLSMLFFLLSIWWYLKDDGTTRRSRAYVLSILAFALAMLSKGSVAILPGVLLLIAWWRRDEITRVDLRKTVPFFIVAGVLTVVTLWFRTHGASEAFRDASLSERVAGAGAIIWFYVSKALVPVRLTFVYPLWKVDVRNVLWWLPTIAAVIVTAGLWLGRSRPWVKASLFAWLYFCLCLLPVLGFTDANYVKYSLVADHYQYLGLVGVCALVAAGLERVVAR